MKPENVVLKVISSHRVSQERKQFYPGAHSLKRKIFTQLC
jgi:hypothetical protein